MPLSLFAHYADADVVDLIAAYPLAWVSTGAGGATSLLPLLAETDTAGRVVALIGHMARHNPLATALAADPQAQLLFTGPQGYITPALVSRPGWAPTWNYAQLRIDARVLLQPDEADHALALLVDHMEREAEQPWTAAQMGPRYAMLRQGIIAFRAEVIRLEGRFKLGQDEAVPTLKEILAGHADPALVHWMRRMNADRL